MAMLVMAEVMGAFSREQPAYFQRNILGGAALGIAAFQLLFYSIFYGTEALLWFFLLSWNIITCLLMVLIMKTLKTSSWPGVLKKLANMGALLVFLATVYNIIIQLIFLLIAKHGMASTRWGFWNFIGFATYAGGQLFLMMVITVMGLRHMSAKKTEGDNNDDAENVDHTEKLHHPDSSSDEEQQVQTPEYNDN